MRLILFLVSFLLISCQIQAAEKHIVLKDGSVLRGTVVEFNGDTYTIETSNLGKLQLNDRDIVSISTSENVQNSGSSPNHLNGTGQASGLLSSPQAQQIQQSIMSDPKMMEEIQRLASDPDIASLLTNPQTLQDIMSQDPARIQNNPQIQKLMQNPDMQRFIRQLTNSLLAP